MSFKERFNLIQNEIKERKMYMVARRAMERQKRAKIKPSEMNPVLLNSPISGGDAINTGPSLNLFWPSSN